MTRKEIEARKAEIAKMRKNTPEIQREMGELCARSMINSCLVYREMYNYYDVKTGEWGKYGIKDRDFLGEKRLLEIIEEQKADFAKATVMVGVHTDNEGVVYNSIKWADD